MDAQKNSYEWNEFGKRKLLGVAYKMIDSVIL